MSLAVAAAVDGSGREYEYALITVNARLHLGPQICSVSALIHITIEWTIDPYPKFSD